MMGSLSYHPPVAERRRNAGVTDEAIEQIRVLVASGEWGPGTRLPREADLAAQLGLSRNSLREAVRALSLIRVLEVRQGDGTYVSSLDPDGDRPPSGALGARALRGAPAARARSRRTRRAAPGRGGQGGAQA